jgi:hypothetical protein
MEVDVIILSYAKNNSIVEMNDNCINSLNGSTDEHTFNILLIDTRFNIVGLFFGIISFILLIKALRIKNED